MVVFDSGVGASTLLILPKLSDSFVSERDVLPFVDAAAIAAAAAAALAASRYRIHFFFLLKKLKIFKC